jgi:hypothetical protein
VRHRRKYLGALAGLLSLTFAVPVPAAGAEEGRVRAADITSAGDPTGDVSDCRGDLDFFGAGYETPAGTTQPVVVVATETVCGNDIDTSPAWANGNSFAGWWIDVDGDGDEDYYAMVANFGGPGAGVWSVPNWAYVCDAAALSDNGGRFLAARFDAGCLGTPSSFRVAAEFQLDTAPVGKTDECASCTFDIAPDDNGWGATTVHGTPAPAPAPAPAKRQGYWMVDRVGKVYSFGDAGHFGDVQGLAAGMEAVDLEPSPSGNGYWVVTNTGHVYAFRDAGHVGALNGSLAVGESVTSLSATPTGQGYWLFTSKGRVVPFGDAQFHGDMRNTALNGAVLDSIPTPSGHGYYMVGSDGGIFTFGDAQFFGSTGSMKLNAPVQSLVPDPDGAGYWLVASDGGIFAFDGAFYGSMGDRRLNGPVTGMVGFGNGYLMVGEDGGIFTFGEAPFFGSLGANPPAQPIVSVAILNQ